MTPRKKTDQRPGCVPEIRATGDSVIFLIDVTDVDGHARLIIRCDPDGALLASIEQADTH